MLITLENQFQFVQFLERLARALNMEEISHDIGIDLHTESILLRAEQLSRLESEKLVDKVLCSFNFVLLCKMIIYQRINLNNCAKAAWLSYWTIAATTS